MKRTDNKDLEHMDRAIQLAREAEQEGNLPIGAVITLDNEIIAVGRNSVRTHRPNRHAEIEALENIPAELLNRAEEMTLYTTLEPCLMCLGAILVYRIGHVVFGAKDWHGGAVSVFDHMPHAFKRLYNSANWHGPVLTRECDELSERVITMVNGWNAEHPRKSVESPPQGKTTQMGPLPSSGKRRG